MQPQILFLIASIVGLSSRLVLAKQLKADLPVVSLPIQHKFRPGRLSKRDPSSIYGSYTIVFGIGTPIQTQSAILDTGSSDLWVNGPWTDKSPCYDPFSSSTYKYNSSDFYIVYGAGEASGYWVRDTVNIAGQSITDQSFGLVYGKGGGDPVFGVGPIADEVSKTPYTNVPQTLSDQGLIKTPSYSIYLSDLEKGNGQILFGGLDTEKYQGKLYGLPIVDKSSLFVDLNQLTIGNEPMLNDNQPTEVLIDSGTTFCYFAPDVADKIASQFGAQQDERTGLYFLDSNKFTNKDFEFNFSGAKIKVPISEMIVESSLVVQGNPPAKYVVGIMAAEKPPYILGDTFLRSTYAVFDLKNEIIAIAQAKYVQDANITVITPEGIPYMEPAPGYTQDNGGYKTFLTIGTPSPSGTMQQLSSVQSSVSSAPSSSSSSSSAPWWWPFGSWWPWPFGSDW